MMFQSQLYGRAIDLFVVLDQSIIESSTGTQAIVYALFLRDPLSVLADVHRYLNELLDCFRNTNEHVRYFESRFSATLSRLNSYGTSSKLSESLSSLMLLTIAAVDGSQRIAVLAAASPYSSKFTNKSTTHDFIDSVSYVTIASVIQQC